MKGVILSGGKGTRLAPVTLDYPKQLLPVMGKPILFYTIEYMIEAAEKGDKNSLYFVAKAYDTGIGLIKNE